MMNGSNGAVRVRSRSRRPCDACRRGKIRCTVSEAGPPCTHCRELVRACTFEEKPPPRKPPTNQSTQTHTPLTANATTISPSTVGGIQANVFLPKPDIRHTTSLLNSVGKEGLTPSQDCYDHLADNELIAWFVHDVAKDVVGKDYTELQDPSFPTPSVYVYTVPKSSSPAEVPNTSLVDLYRMERFISGSPVNSSPAEVLQIYRRFIHPTLPILPDVTPLPPRLHALALSAGMNHHSRLRPLAQIACNIVELDSAPAENLMQIAAAVLQINLRPSEHSRTSFVLLAKTIAEAQLLGLHLDPSMWQISQRESFMRKTLWWSLLIHDAWMSFLKCRPPHAQSQNNLVPIPDLSSLLLASCSFGPSSTDSARVFIAQCELSRLVSQLNSDICSFTAASVPAESREAIINTAVGQIDAQLQQWQQYLVPGETARPTGIPNLLIMLLGLRSLVKRISLYLDPLNLEELLGPTIATNAGTLEYFSDLIKCVETLSDEEVDGFFFVYCRHILLATMSCLIRLALSQTQGSVDLLRRFARAIRHFHTSCNWDLAAMCFHRANDVRCRLLSTGEHSDVCTALSGGEVPISDENVRGDSFSQLQLGNQFPWDWTGLDLDIGQLLNLPPA